MEDHLWRSVELEQCSVQGVFPFGVNLEIGFAFVIGFPSTTHDLLAAQQPYPDCGNQVAHHESCEP